MEDYADRYLRARDIHRPHGVLPISRSHFHALKARGEFPPGDRLSKGVVAWLESDVLAWARKRAEEFSNFVVPEVRDLRARQKMGVQAWKSAARRRWNELADEYLARGGTLEDFVDERHADSHERPYRYPTRNGPRGYTYDTMMRELRKIIKERRKASR